MTDSSLPAPFVSLLVLTALLSIATTFFFKTDAKGPRSSWSPAFHRRMPGLFFTLILQYPFSGSVTVGTDVLYQGSLGHLLTMYP